ncbi:AC transposase [Artemisia annua]|uniref:AC transposase n=1 Tax=Artemisia annua TaxID=35608 RepID=A0A2U1PJY1_ARTAN|nr:AC transposase [Artemisia annua]
MAAGCGQSQSSIGVGDSSTNLTMVTLKETNRNLAIWSNYDLCVMSNDSFLCVTAHWVNPKTWVMMKRTISFELFGYHHTGENLYAILDKVIKTYNLNEKNFAISFDNASNNDVAVD